jgi:hypothetical protein
VVAAAGDGGVGVLVAGGDGGRAGMLNSSGGATKPYSREVKGA